MDRILQRETKGNLFLKGSRQETPQPNWYKRRRIKSFGSLALPRIPFARIQRPRQTATLRPVGLSGKKKNNGCEIGFPAFSLSTSPRRKLPSNCPWPSRLSRNCGLNGFPTQKVTLRTLKKQPQGCVLFSEHPC